MDAWLKRLTEEIEDAAGGLTDEQWHQAPAGRWTSGQILEHLGRSYGTTAKMLELALAAGTPPLRRDSLRARLGRLMVLGAGHFPRGVTAPALVTPTGDDGADALHRALENLRRMESALDAAEVRWGPGPIASHMMLGPMTGTQWRRFHYIHGHHHMKQVRERTAIR